MIFLQLGIFSCGIILLVIGVLNYNDEQPTEPIWAVSGVAAVVIGLLGLTGVI